MSRLPNLTVTYEDRSVRLASRDNALIAVWRDPPNRARATALRALQRRLRTDHPDVVMLHVINAGQTSPLTLPEDGRAELLAAMRDPPPHRSVVAVAIEGSSFFVAAWRSIMSAATLIVRPPYPLKIHATRDLAAAWLESQSSGWPRAVATKTLLESVGQLEGGLEPP